MADYLTRKQSSYTFTVFTPTYNRAHTLDRVYSSLKRQTYQDFEWLIVDDGSEDETRELVKRWQREAIFRVNYLFQENRGKHVAFNLAVRHAHGELFLPFDSDDECVSTALERFKFHWDGIPANRKREFSAVTVLCKDQHGRLVGDRFPQDITDSDSLEIWYRYRVRGEKWGFHRTDVLQQFPFPETPGIQFVPEGIIWGAIARRYKTRFVNDILRIYWTDDGQIDHLSQLTKKVAQGRAFYHRHVLNDRLSWMPYAPMDFIRSAINYSRYSFFAGQGLADQATPLRHLAKLLWLLCLPLGFAAYLVNKA